MEIKASNYKPNEILKFIRENSKKTQQELADDIQKSKSWVKHNEQGISRYSFEDLLKVAKKCNVEIIIKSKNND